MNTIRTFDPDRPAQIDEVRQALRRRYRTASVWQFGLACAIGAMFAVPFTAKPEWALLVFFGVEYVSIRAMIALERRFSPMSVIHGHRILNWYIEHIQTPVDRMIDAHDLDGARTSLHEMGPQTPWEAFQRERLRARLSTTGRTTAGGGTDVARAMAALSPQELVDAEAALAVDDSVRLLAANGDWFRRLLDARQRVQGMRTRYRSTAHPDVHRIRVNVMAVAAVVGYAVLLSIAVLSDWPPISW